MAIIDANDAKADHDCGLTAESEAIPAIGVIGVAQAARGLPATLPAGIQADQSNGLAAGGRYQDRAGSAALASPHTAVDACMALAVPSANAFIIAVANCIC